MAILCGLAWATALGGARGAQTAPASADEARDISGIWYGTGYYDKVNLSFTPMDGGDPPFTPAGLALFNERRAADKAGHPIHPPGSDCARANLIAAEEVAPMQIIQTPGQITFIAEEYHDFGVVLMDRPHPRTMTPSFMGNSVGHWEGDTLVIDTVGFREGRWLDYRGEPATAELRIVEHIRKVKTDAGKTVLENIITVTDPKMYTKPWNVRRLFLWRPGERVNEEICEETGTLFEPGDPSNANALGIGRPATTR